MKTKLLCLLLLVTFGTFAQINVSESFETSFPAGWSTTGQSAGFTRGTYSYSWNTNPIQTSATANNLIAGTYIVTVTDDKGCTDTETVTITEPAAALVAAIGTPTNVSCFGGNTGAATASATSSATKASTSAVRVATPA